MSDPKVPLTILGNADADGICGSDGCLLPIGSSSNVSPDEESLSSQLDTGHD